MSLDPWIIEQREEEERRRRQEEEQRQRIELPQTAPKHAPEERGPSPRVTIVEISPADDDVISI